MRSKLLSNIPSSTTLRWLTPICFVMLRARMFDPKSVHKFAKSDLECRSVVSHPVSDVRTH
jgi:hypothetical protein